MNLIIFYLEIIHTLTRVVGHGHGQSDRNESVDRLLILLDSPVAGSVCSLVSQ